MPQFVPRPEYIRIEQHQITHIQVKVSYKTIMYLTQGPSNKLAYKVHEQFDMHNTKSAIRSKFSFQEAYKMNICSYICLYIVHMFHLRKYLTDSEVIWNCP
jgi:hypothetical protein